jgi:hypothetical protein
MRSKTALTRFIHGFAWWKMTRPLLPSNVEKQHAADQKDRTLKTALLEPLSIFCNFNNCRPGVLDDGRPAFYPKDEEGNYVLAPWRQRKMERELRAIDEAEQYALLRAVKMVGMNVFIVRGSSKNIIC